MRRVTVTLPAAALIHVLCTIATNHDGPLAELLDDLAARHANTGDDTLNPVEWERACEQRWVACQALLAAVGPVVWEMGGVDAFTLGGDITEQAQLALGMVRCTACAALVHQSAAVWEDRMFAAAEPFCGEPCRDSYVERQLEAAAERGA